MGCFSAPEYWLGRLRYWKRVAPRSSMSLAFPAFYVGGPAAPLSIPRPLILEQWVLFAGAAFYLAPHSFHPTPSILSPPLPLLRSFLFGDKVSAWVFLGCAGLALGQEWRGGLAKRGAALLDEPGCFAVAAVRMGVCVTGFDRPTVRPDLDILVRAWSR